MTNADRKAARDYANALRSKLNVDRAALAAAADAARALANVLDAAICAVANASRLAGEITDAAEAPTAARLRDLASSERHLDKWARRAVRQSRRKLSVAQRADFDGALMYAERDVFAAIAHTNPVTVTE